MNYFTPELFLQINSSKDAVVDRAMERWEKAVTAYRKHLSTMLKGMRSEVRELASLSLHDWELVNLVTDHRAAAPSDAGVPVWYSTALITVRDGEKLSILFYVLWDKVQQAVAPENWPLSKKRVHWLYDELELADGRKDRLVHRILLSNGATLAIPFSACIVQQLDMDHAITKSDLLQSA